jgi:hypothetical protein
MTKQKAPLTYTTFDGREVTLDPENNAADKKAITLWGVNAKSLPKLQALGETLLEIQKRQRQRFSSRGWGYLHEGKTLLGKMIQKSNFEVVQEGITTCRKLGILPIDFCLEDAKREWRENDGIYAPTKVNEENPQYEIVGVDNDPISDFKSSLWDTYNHHTASVSAIGSWNNSEWWKKQYPSWWNGKKYYLQMLVEKIDLVEFFDPVCKKYNIPIANSGGWSDLGVRAKAIKRFQQAEDLGAIPVLLYFGDFDFTGLYIAEKVKDLLNDLQNSTGWSPENLVFRKVGLDADFIDKFRLPWVHSIATGNKENKDPLESASALTRRNSEAWIQMMQERYHDDGIRKCESNAIFLSEDAKEAVLALLKQEIEGFYGNDEEYDEKWSEVRKRENEFKEKVELELEQEKDFQYLQVDEYKKTIEQRFEEMLS